jgi:hypothetical protein
MPITSDLGGKNYTLGRGRLFFDRFTPAQVSAGIGATTAGEGERYFGNTPEFSLTSEEETLDHFDSDGGIRVKDDSVSLQLNRTGSFTTDNIDAGNLALMFLADGVGSVTQVSATAATYVVTVKRGRFFQVGATQSLPAGVRNISTVLVGKGAGFSTAVTAATNWEIDEALGRIYILPGAPDIADNTEIQITYNLAATTREQIISKSTAIYGALRFVADNPKGINRDFYMPYVKLAPDGDFALKGDDWQAMSFSFEVLIKASNIEGVYIDGRGA